MVISFSSKDNSELGFHDCFYAMVFSVLNTAQIQYDSKGVDLNKMISCDENEIPYSFLPESEAILVGDVLSSYGLSEDMSLIKSDVNM